MMQIFRPNLHNDSRPRFNSTQAFLLVQKLKSALRAELLGIKGEAKKKKIFSICTELLIHAELYGLVLAPSLKKKGIPTNLRSEFATLGANVPAFTNILTSMF
jgi:hypothetical protein